MCTDEQHKQKMAALERIEKLLAIKITGREPRNHTISISDIQGYVLDYQDRKHLYLFSTAALFLNLGELGILSIAANTWTLIDFKPGFKLFTSGQATPINLFVRATDEVIA